MPPIGNNAGKRTSRKNTVHSCDSCRQKKIHCDGRKPVCEWCQHRHLQCTFVLPHRINRNISSKKLREPEDERVKKGSRSSTTRRYDVADLKLSQSLGKVCDKDESTFTFVGDTSESSETTIFELLDALQASLYKSILSPSCQKWMERCTVERTWGIMLPGFHLCPHYPNVDLKAVLIEARELLPRALVQKCLHLYNSSQIALSFPIIDSIRFQATIDAFFKGEARCTSEACVFAFAAFIASHFPEISLLLDVERCDLVARSFIPEILSQPTSLEGLQTILLLAIGRGCSGDYDAIHAYMDIAGRMTCSLGGHMNSKTHSRTLFWLTYFLDTDLAILIGRTPAIVDEDCDLTLPELYSEITVHLDADSQPFPSDLRLSLIKSKIFSLLYSNSARKASSAEIIRVVRELDKELEEWRVSLPTEHRPSLSRRNHAPCMKIRWIFIQSEYIRCINTIHAATSRCIAWAKNNNNLEALSSSLAVSIEASRAYLLFLDSVPGQNIPFASYWVFSFYVMGTSLMLFYNILLDPVHIRASQDLELIDKATIVLDRFPSKLVHGNAAEKTQFKHCFAELSSLANKAIVAASQ